MKDGYAQELLARVMGWVDPDIVQEHVPILQLLSDYKYDEYQRFGPGKKFIESLALWLSQFGVADREIALSLVERRLVFISEREMSHLVQLAYPDVIVPHRLRIVAEENGIPPYQVGRLVSHSRFKELETKSLYLGLSDGAHTNELRRGSNGGISNEQIWQAYELGETKAEDMLDELRKALATGSSAASSRFGVIWLVDDFSGSGNTYIRYDAAENKFKGKIKKIYERLLDGLVHQDYYDVSLLLYVATRQAIDHIEYWSERFTSENGYNPLKLHVLWPIETDVPLSEERDGNLLAMLRNPSYYDTRASDKHIAVGGSASAQLGFAECALPLVLSHNTPNNSVYALWGPEEFSFSGLFPRVSRHRET